MSFLSFSAGQTQALTCTDTCMHTFMYVRYTGFFDRLVYAKEKLKWLLMDWILAKGPKDALQAPDQGAGDGMVPSSGLTALGLSCPPGLFWGQVEVDRNLVARLFFGTPCRCCCFVWIHLSKWFCGLVWPGEADGSCGSALQATSEDQACNWRGQPTHTPHSKS